MRKWGHRRAWQRLFYERLTEPMHLNAISAVVAVVGSFRLKVQYDLIIRPQAAFGILRAADRAKENALSSVSVLEFGVAAGYGLVNMCLIAQKVTAATGVEVKVYGFDTGKGMPAPRDYRDHPDLYKEGDFPSDLQALRGILPANGTLVIGELSETVPHFLKTQLSSDSPIGYTSVDVDYYSSTVDALKIFLGSPRLYLPTVSIYLDDIHFEVHNPFAGELLAVNEFNATHALRKINQHNFLEVSRVFHRSEWLKHMFLLQVMDHPARATINKGAPNFIENPYL